MNPAEYEAMYRLEDGLWWYTGMRRITAAALDGRLQGRQPDPARRAGLARQAGPARRSERARRTLDAGCGSGGNLAWLTGYGPAWGVDLSPLATGYCRRRGLDTVARASVTRLPFADGTFDLVTSFDVIYHLDVTSDVSALAEMRRVLRPGGTLFVRVPALAQLRSAHDAAVHTRQRYTARELRQKVTLAGMQVERASYANAALLPLAAASRLARRRGPGGDQGPEHAAVDASSDVRPLPAPLNALFGAVLNLEAALLAHVDLPIGLSAFVVARRPA